MRPLGRYQMPRLATGSTSWLTGRQKAARNPTPEEVCTGLYEQVTTWENRRH